MSGRLIGDINKIISSIPRQQETARQEPPLGIPEGFTPTIPHRPGPGALNHPGPGTTSPHVDTSTIPGYDDMDPNEQRAAREARRQDILGFRQEGRDPRYPRYSASDVFRVFLDMSVVERTQLQRDMQAAGLLDEYTEGVLDNATRSALEFVMGQANMEGKSWQSALVDIGSAHVIEAEGMQTPDPSFVQRPYVAPDYATLADGVRGLFKQQLRRDPTDSELAALADELSDFHRQAFEAEIEVERAMFDAQQEAAEQDGGEVQAADVSPEVDWQSRFRERFNEKYQSQLATIDETDAQAVNMQNLIQSLTVGAGTMGR